MIELKEISKTYGSNKVLRGITAQIDEGSIIGIVGINGAGKTTLFNCITGLITHKGVVSSRYENIKNHIGYLQTNPIFLSRITGWEYLKMTSLARGITFDKFEEQNIFELPLDQYAETYSTGMKKKLALMSVLIQKNDIYILDEPFNGVDIQSNILIIEIIKKLKSAKKTIIMSSHIFSTLSTLCDEIHLLEQGLFSRSVTRENFDQLDLDIKDYVIGDKLDKLNL